MLRNEFIVLERMEHSSLEHHYANEIIPVPDYRSGHDCCRLFVLQRAGVGDESGKLSRRSTYFFRHERFIPIWDVSWRNAMQCRNSSKSWRQNLGHNYDMGDPSYECSRSLHPEDGPWQSTTTIHVAARAILRPFKAALHQNKIGFLFRRINPRTREFVSSQSKIHRNGPSNFQRMGQ